MIQNCHKQNTWTFFSLWINEIHSKYDVKDTEFTDFFVCSAYRLILKNFESSSNNIVVTSWAQLSKTRLDKIKHNAGNILFSF